MGERSNFLEKWCNNGGLPAREDGNVVLLQCASNNFALSIGAHENGDIAPPGKRAMGLCSEKRDAICLVVFIGVTLNGDCVAVEFGGTCSSRNAIVGEHVQTSCHDDRRAAVVVDQVHNVRSTEFFGKGVEQ